VVEEVLLAVLDDEVENEVVDFEALEWLVDWLEVVLFLVTELEDESTEDDDDRSAELDVGTELLLEEETFVTELVEIVDEEPLKLLLEEVDLRELLEVVEELDDTGEDEDVDGCEEVDCTEELLGVLADGDFDDVREEDVLNWWLELVPVLFGDIDVEDVPDWWLEPELKLDNVVFVEADEDTVLEDCLPELELEWLEVDELDEGLATVLVEVESLDVELDDDFLTELELEVLLLDRPEVEEEWELLWEEVLRDETLTVVDVLVERELSVDVKDFEDDDEDEACVVLLSELDMPVDFWTLCWGAAR
jgi:hypothetical protein